MKLKKIFICVLFFMVLLVTSCGNLLETGSDTTKTFGSSNSDEVPNVPSEETNGTADSEETSGNEEINKDYQYNANYHWVSSDDGKNDGYCAHSLANNTCTVCGMIYNEALFSCFGDDVTIYSNSNPYGIDLSSYGSNVNAIFYTPNLSTFDNIYDGLNKNAFYDDYFNISLSYEDSYYRSQNGIISGNIGEPNHTPGTSAVYNGKQAQRASTATYVLDTNGEYIGYFPNDLSGQSNPIWYCGGYVLLDEVAAYLLAFGEVPCNSNYDKNSGRNSAISKWGKYGRVNKDSFSGDTTKYPTEPVLPLISGVYQGGIKYTETDYGTYDIYTNGTYIQGEYNDGSSINRGAARLVFVSDSKIKSIDDRYVFYTYNHYNDFQEYLNYNGGYGVRFGNESAGNPYGQLSSDVYGETIYPSQYPKAFINSFANLLIN